MAGVRRLLLRLSSSRSFSSTPPPPPPPLTPKMQSYIDIHLIRHMMESSATRSTRRFPYDLFMLLCSTCCTGMVGMEVYDRKVREWKLHMAALVNLKVKSGTCKRIMKELKFYEKELERAKIADLKATIGDPDLKLQENVWAELRMKIYDGHKRLEMTLANLKETLLKVELENQKKRPETEEARAIIAEVEIYFQTPEA